MSDTVTLQANPSSSPATSITINGPVPESQPVEPFANYVSDLSAGGTRYAYKVNDSDLKTWTLFFRDLTTSQKNDLEDLFNDDVGGPGRTLSYTHTDGNTYSVEFADNKLNFTREGPDQWGVTLRFETEAQVS